MKSQIAFPSPTELADRTPAERDRPIDVIRITALIGVVVGDTVMATSVIRNTAAAVWISHHRSLTLSNAW